MYETNINDYRHGNKYKYHKKVHKKNLGQNACKRTSHTGRFKIPLFKIKCNKFKKFFIITRE